MGTDCTIAAEVYKEGKWQSPHLIEKSLIRGFSEGLIDDAITYSDRNYVLFAVLAGIRNYHDIPSLNYIKLNTNECTLETQYGLSKYNETPSYYSVTLQQLLEYDWQHKIKVEDIWVTPEDLEKFKRTNYLNEYKTDSMVRFGRNEQQFHEFTEGKQLVTLELPVAYFCFNFLSETLPNLLVLGKPEEVRLVFTFW